MQSENLQMQGECNKNFCNHLGSGYHLPLAASNTLATKNKTFNEGKFVLKHKENAWIYL